MPTRTAHPTVVGEALKNHAALSGGDADAPSSDLLVTLITKLCEDAMKQGKVSTKLISTWRKGTTANIQQLVDRQMHLLTPEIRMVLACQLLTRGVITNLSGLSHSSSSAHAMSGIGHHCNDQMLTTEQAAQMMGYSRTHVSMLVDNDQLPGSVKSQGNHRRIPRSAVETYMATHQPSAGEGDYRVAAQQAGMYNLSETAYVVESKPKRPKTTKTP